MGNLFRVLRLIGPYRALATGVVSLNLASIIFSLFSLTMVIPFLGILFGTQPIVTHRVPLSLSGEAMSNNFYWLIGQVILDENGHVTESGKVRALLFVCLFVVVMFFFKNLFRYLASFYQSRLKNSITRDLRNRLFSKVMHLHLDFHSDERKGDIISRCTTDAQEVEASVVSSLEVLFKEPVTILLFLGTMVVMSPSLTLFVLMVLPITGFVIGRIGRSLKKTSMLVQGQMGTILSILDESLMGLRIIKAFNAIGWSERKFSQESEKLYRLQVRMSRRRELASPMSEFLGTIVMVTVMWYGGRLVLADEGMQAATFIGYITIFSQLINPAKSFATAVYNIQKGMASADRIQQILDTPEAIRQPENPKPIKSFDREIEFRNLSFDYADGTEVLRDINLTVRKGRTLAIVGQSGAGKSTLADLIPRFYDPTQGQVLIDGTDIREYDIIDLRNLLGIVTQDALLFNDSVFNNIAFGLENVNQNDVERAARIANAHDFIMQLDQGYNTPIGDMGNKLSGGQRQRLSIARAVLHNPPILVLDEATSALDTESERLVQEALYNLMKHRTSIVIAHRLSTIQYADEIIVMQDGRIIERGNHLGLVAHNGVYKRLYEMQAFV